MRYLSGILLFCLTALSLWSSEIVPDSLSQITEEVTTEFVTGKKKGLFSLTQVDTALIKKQRPSTQKFLDFLYKKDSVTIRGWRLSKDLAEMIPTSMDTIPLDFQRANSPYAYTPAVSWLGNLGLAAQSKLFFDRKSEEGDFIFLNNHDYYLQDPTEFVFLNSKMPYTNLSYWRTFISNMDEERFKTKMAINVNKRLNVGFDFDYIYARGLYQNQLTSLLQGGVFTNYLGDNYQLHFYFNGGDFRNQENGGVTDDRFISNPDATGIQYQSRDIPVYLNQAGNISQQYTAFLSHRYNFGFVKTYPNDTTRKEFVPFTSIIHTMEFHQNSYRYFDRNGNSGSAPYDTAYFNKAYTNDTTSLWSVRNTIGISLREGFQKWAVFGLTAFVKNDTRQYMLMNGDSTHRYHLETDFWAGAELFRRQGRYINYNALAEFCFAGNYIGDLKVLGNIDSRFKILSDTITISASGYFKLVRPSFYWQHYSSNHYIWDQTMERTIRANAFIEMADKRRGVALNFGFENITNPAYFNIKGIASQSLTSVQILSARLRLNLKFGIFHLDNDVTWQLSSRPDIIPLPDLSLYHNIYLLFPIAKVLKTQIGADINFHTRYYAPAYNPALRQFQLQDQVLIGDYPLVSVYANLHLKRMRFFVMMTNLVQMFTPGNYFDVPHYPLNPSMLKFGLSWNFYD